MSPENKKLLAGAALMAVSFTIAILAADQLKKRLSFLA